MMLSARNYSVQLSNFLPLPFTCSKAEKLFFQSHESFCTCDPKVLGVEQLSKKLSALLVTRIQLQLAPMKAHAEKSLGTQLHCACVTENITVCLLFNLHLLS